MLFRSEQAQANADAAAGSYFPSFDARGSAARQGRAVNYSGPTFNLFNASVSVAYVLDVFGGVRRSVEATEALAETSRFRMEATYSALTSNVLTTAIRVASVQAQISATQDIIKAQSQELDLLNQQFELGAVAKGDVLAQQSQLANRKSTRLNSSHSQQSRMPSSA